MAEEVVGRIPKEGSAFDDGLPGFGGDRSGPVEVVEFRFVSGESDCCPGEVVGGEKAGNFHLGDEEKHGRIEEGFGITFAPCRGADVADDPVGDRDCLVEAREVREAKVFEVGLRGVGERIADDPTAVDLEDLLGFRVHRSAHKGSLPSKFRFRRGRDRKKQAKSEAARLDRLLYYSLSMNRKTDHVAIGDGTPDPKRSSCGVLGGIEAVTGSGRDLEERGRRIWREYADPSGSASRRAAAISVGS